MPNHFVWSEFSIKLCNFDNESSLKRSNAMATQYFDTSERNVVFEVLVFEYGSEYRMVSAKGFMILGIQISFQIL